MRVFHGRLARLVITGLAVCACTARAGAQTQFEVIHRFSEVDPPYAPGAGLVQGTDGQPTERAAGNAHYLPCDHHGQRWPN